MYEDLFPKDRDVYASGEVASLFFNIPIGVVEMLHMQRATKKLIELGVIKKIHMRDGTPSMFAWPGSGRAYGLYAVRNFEKYKDPDNAIAHLAGVHPPEDTNLSNRKRRAIALRVQKNIAKYGRLGPRIEKK